MSLCWGISLCFCLGAKTMGAPLTAPSRANSVQPLISNRNLPSGASVAPQAYSGRVFIQEYWDGAEPRYWIANYSSVSLTLALQGNGSRGKNASSSLAPVQSATFVIPAGGGVSEEGSLFMQSERVLLRDMTSGALYFSLPAPSMYAFQTGGFPIRLMDSVNGMELPHPSLWFELASIPKLGDKTLDITIRVTAPQSGWLSISRPSSEELPYLNVVAVSAPGLEVRQVASGAWAIDTRSTKKLVHNILLHCATPNMSQSQVAFLNINLVNEKRTILRLSRGFLFENVIAPPQLLPNSSQHRLVSPSGGVH